MVRTLSWSTLLLPTLTVAIIAFCLLQPHTSHAATNDFTQIREALENLQSSMKQLRASSTTPKRDRATLQSASSTRQTPNRALDMTCMQTAVDVRETALMSALEAFQSQMISAMEKRKTAFSSVWTGTEISSNRSRYSATWSTWKKEHKVARDTLRRDREAAWKTFRTTATESCKAKLPKEESASQEGTL